MLLERPRTALSRLAPSVSSSRLLRHAHLLAAIAAEPIRRALLDHLRVRNAQELRVGHVSSLRSWRLHPGIREVRCWVVSTLPLVGRHPIHITRTSVVVHLHCTVRRSCLEYSRYQSASHSHVQPYCHPAHVLLRLVAQPFGFPDRCVRSNPQAQGQQRGSTYEWSVTSHSSHTKYGVLTQPAQTMPM